MAIVKHKVDIDKMIEDVKDIAINSTDFYRSTETDIGILAYAVYVLLQQLKGVMMSDLIRREDAIKALYKYSFVSKDVIEREINAIPSVDIPHSDDWEKYSDKLWKNAYERGKADRPQGEWVDMGDFEKCSVCKGTRLKEFQSYYGKVTWIKTPYCPQCGARMKGMDGENVDE